MNRRSGAPPPALLIAANLAVDVVTAEVVGALRGEGVRSILLKGPAISAWLYGEETEAPRTYDDLDLLVPPEAAERSHRVLTGLGFANRFAEFAPGESVEREEALRDEAEERVRGTDRRGARGRPRASGWYEHRETDDQENGTNIDVIQMDEPGRAS